MPKEIESRYFENDDNQSKEYFIDQNKVSLYIRMKEKLQTIFQNFIDWLNE